MKNMKRTLAFLLTCVLLLTPFATIPASAMLIPKFHFSLSGYAVGVSVDDIVVEEHYEGKIWNDKRVYDAWEAHIEYENGEIVTGDIERFTNYVLSIRIYGISSEIIGCDIPVTIENDNVKEISYFRDDSSVIVKYKLATFVEIPEAVLNLSGYEVGADPKNMTLTCEADYVSCEFRLIPPTYELFEEPIREGVGYYLYVAIVPDSGYELSQRYSAISLKLSTGISISTSLPSFFGSKYEGYIRLPILGDALEKISEIDFDIEGYEVGNTVSQIRLNPSEENITVDNEITLRVSEKHDPLEGGSPIGLGKEYILRSSFKLPKGYDLEGASSAAYGYIEHNIFSISAVRLNGVELLANAQRKDDNYETFSITVALPMLYIDGDVDYDGVHTVSDALKLLRIAAKTAYGNGRIVTVGDLDGDGEISVSDALAVLRLAAKLN